MLLTVLVPTSVTHPDVITGGGENERQIRALGDVADPDFGTHHEAMIEQDNWLAGVNVLIAKA